MSEMVYAPRHFAKMIGRTVRTLQRWDVEGSLVAHRNPKNRRYYTHDQYLSYLGIKADSNKKIVAYCRVSSSGQKEDLSSQQKALEDYCRAKGYCVDDWLVEVGSGLNYTRKKFNLLLEEVELGKVS